MRKYTEKINISCFFTGRTLAAAPSKGKRGSAEKPLAVVFSEESFNQNLRKKHRPQKKLDFFVKECYNE